jgi:hypothetical protein
LARRKLKSQVEQFSTKVLHAHFEFSVRHVSYFVDPH